MNTIEVEVSCDGSCNNEDCEGFHEFEFPATFRVCHDCEGHGTVLNPSMREHAYTQEEFERDFNDEDRAQYFKRGGIYDVTCPTCKGRNVVLVGDQESIASGNNEEQKRQLAAYLESERNRAREERADRATRRMEMGGY